MNDTHRSTRAFASLTDRQIGDSTGEALNAQRTRTTHPESTIGTESGAQGAATASPEWDGSPSSRNAGIASDGGSVVKCPQKAQERREGPSATHVAHDTVSCERLGCTAKLGDAEGPVEFRAGSFGKLTDEADDFCSSDEQYVNVQIGGGAIEAERIRAIGTHVRGGSSLYVNADHFAGSAIPSDEVGRTSTGDVAENLIAQSQQPIGSGHFGNSAFVGRANGKVGHMGTVEMSANKSSPEIPSRSPVTLWREVDALGGAPSGHSDFMRGWDAGHKEAIGAVLAILERRGFTEYADASASTFRSCDVAAFRPCRAPTPAMPRP